MLDLHKINYLADKYMPKLLDSIKEYQYNTVEEATLHTEQLNKAERADPAARRYVLNYLKKILIEIVNKEDLKIIRETVINEYKVLLKKKYETFDGSYIGYYQLIDNYIKKEDREKLKNTNIERITGIDEFTFFIYQKTYGADCIEPFLTLNVNNIEVHGTNSVRIETNSGIWKVIKDYRFEKDEDIAEVARRLLSQKDSSDITKIDCEKEGMLADGSRISILLKPASKENQIFIKKFDSVSIEAMQDLVNNGTITKEIYQEFKIYAIGKATIGFIGDINAGKSTTMKAYVGLIPDNEKIGIIGSDFETDWLGMYPKKDLVILRETEKYNMNDQFIRLLRTNRTRIIIEEARSYEVLQFINSSLRGGSGSALTMHTITSESFVENMASMCLEDGIQKDLNVMRLKAATAVNIVVRNWYDTTTGKRIVDQVSEIVPKPEKGVPYEINRIFERNISTGEVEKVGEISDDLAKKFIYHNVPLQELKKIKSLDNIL